MKQVLDKEVGQISLGQSSRPWADLTYLVIGKTVLLFHVAFPGDHKGDDSEDRGVDSSDNKCMGAIDLIKRKRAERPIATSDCVDHIVKIRTEQIGTDIEPAIAESQA